MTIKRHWLGMSPARFLAEYWQKRPLLIRQAFPGFVCPIDGDELAGLACEDWLASRLVRYQRQDDRYLLEQGPFAEDRFQDLGEQDWTLLVQDVDKVLPDALAELRASFDFLPAWRLDDIMISFAAPGGSVGPHLDHYDVFLIQGSGHRRWLTESQPRLESRFRPDSELRLLPDFDPDGDALLAPGDVLYLPPGFAHHGIAEDDCMTLSVGMRAPSLAELLLDFAEHRAEPLPESRRYADPDLSPAKDPGEIDAAALDRLQALLRSLVEADRSQLGRWFGGFITRYRNAGWTAAPEQVLTPAELLQRLRAGECLFRHPWTRAAFVREGESCRLFLSGDSHSCPEALAQALTSTVPVNLAGDLPDAEELEVLTWAVNGGHFALATVADDASD